MALRRWEICTDVLDGAEYPDIRRVIGRALGDERDATACGVGQPC